MPCANSASASAPARRCRIISSAAQTLTPADHLAVPYAAQQLINSAISKTINVPAAITFAEFENIYRAAYDQGCKGYAAFIAPTT